MYNLVKMDCIKDYIERMNVDDHLPDRCDVDNTGIVGLFER